MADQTARIQEDSFYRVALDLAVNIAVAESNLERPPVQDRAYWLDLYHRCRQVVYNGKTSAEALQAR